MVRVRFAPSPTGYLHIGGLRTALYNYLFARHTGGTFILRIEDTDRTRIVPDAMENLIHTLQKLDITFDEGPIIGGNYGPYIQSERLDLYKKEAQKLLDAGFAYRCFCTPETLAQMRAEQQAKGEFVKYDRRCLNLTPAEIEAKLAKGEPYVLRLKMPETRTFRFNDIIRGEVEMDSAQSDDQVLIKSDGYPTYHLASVVDDHYMDISYVIRGEEWLSSMPKHLWLYECFGWTPPQWVHLPLILNPDRTKLSKRMNDVAVEDYLERGYLKEAIINFVALLGWHSADNREIFSLEELCQEFTLERVNKSGAIFDLNKLNWMNGWYLRNLPLDTIVERSKPYFEKEHLAIPDSDKLTKIVATARERCTLLSDLVQYSKMFLCPQQLSTESLDFLKKEDSRKVLSWFQSHLPSGGDIDAEQLNQLVQQGIKDLGFKGKAFYKPLYLALLHQDHGPELPAIFSILGLKEVHHRIQEVLEL
ncbi:glutamate--tRNA ligase [Candidatus Syntrophosphaera thermopropionivorans]|uniref:Glutamate--tRNA ligase n=1 Tax=Candidatus Syntrophosphaera thermopropionivorans TaxID=2593015 RepID=A0AC61QIU9_9BACT|nr:glutamate--tRNA ligase [Candidatus Syntrophosphaera thermopropionivorans]TDF72880.1 glutamate--tRNA ligase [Candidatus Syntrophosphaera thermopropionivorans]